MAAERETTDGAALNDVDRGEWTMRDADARRYVRGAVDATASLVESTFGPDGMEKLVETEDAQNRRELVRVDDAGRLLDAVERGNGFAHPVAALFVDGVDGMRSGLRDGTTAAVLLAGALLDEGFELVERGLAPSSVVVGYGIARARAGEALDDLARPVDADDREALADVAATTMTTTLDPAVRRRLADRIAETVARLADGRDDGWIDTDDARVLAQTGAETGLCDGLVLSRPADAGATGLGVTEPVEDATVAVVDDEIDFEETASVLDGGDGVRLSSPDAARRYRSELDERIESTAEGLVDRGVDVVVCMEALDESIVRPFQAAGLAVVDKATYPKEDVYRLARATGGTAVSDLRDLTDDRLGRADRVARRRVGDAVWTVFEGCPGPVHTLVAGGATAGEAERRREAVEDALETAAVAAMDGQVLPGAGAPSMAVAAAVRDGAAEVSGREQLAVEAFADAVERLPATLARNAGHDPVTSLTELRAAHADGRSAAGVDPETGDPVDAWEAGVVEPRRVFSQAVETAAAVTERLLTIDAVLYPNVQLPGYTPRPERN
ncbi:TCP-1/cpn60 chaperonin family protein [Halomicrobium salinisoli]|uniref:TCP-1/cpn60 chaperonin family protein n=1 Tax=Halomicrobium salinisoli TaxID=2878391 RepID=UPI001CF0B088|nr:TCP-1/cpn60 chaperonin family protein [Halomicrobium salinisoli]